MAMGTPNSAFTAGQVAELQRENEELREQLRRVAAQQTVVSGAISGAAQEREVATRMAHQVAVEERATRAAVEVQGNSIGFAVILQILSFFLLVLLAFGVFAWLPREMENRFPRPAATVVTPGGGTIVTPR